MFTDNAAVGHLSRSRSLSLSRLLLRLRERLRSAWRLLRSLRESRSRSGAFLSLRPSPASGSALRSRLRSERAFAAAASLSFSPSFSLCFPLHRGKPLKGGLPRWHLPTWSHLVQHNHTLTSCSVSFAVLF